MEEATRGSCNVSGGCTVVIRHGLVDGWSTTEPISRFTFDALDDRVVCVDAITSTAD